MKVIHPNLTFIQKSVHGSPFQENVGLVFNSNFKLLLSTNKPLLRSHLDYCDVIHEKPCSEKFIYILQSIRGNSTLAKTGAIKGKPK